MSKEWEKAASRDSHKKWNDLINELNDASAEAKAKVIDCYIYLP